MYNIGMRYLIVFTFIFLSTSLASADTSLDFLFKVNSENYDDVLVEKVLSADSFEIRGGEKIHLIGLRAPKIDFKKTKDIERDKYGFPIKQPIDPESPIEEQAFNFTVQLLEQKRVRLEFDQHKKDDKLYTYAYAYLKEDGTFVNTEILRNGFAWLQISPVNNKHNDALRAAYKEARENLRGLQSF